MPLPLSWITIRSFESSILTSDASASQALATTSVKTAGALLYRLIPRCLKTLSEIVIRNGFSAVPLMVSDVGVSEFFNVMAFFFCCVYLERHPLGRPVH